MSKGVSSQSVTDAKTAESGIQRRTVLAQIAGLALAGPLQFAEAQHVHQEVAADASTTGGVYQPKALTQHEFDNLKTLAEMIVPGATKGGASSLGLNARLSFVSAGFVDIVDDNQSALPREPAGGGPARATTS